MTFPLGAG